jgi:hypothetical protein
MRTFPIPAFGTIPDKGPTTVPERNPTTVDGQSARGFDKFFTLSISGDPHFMQIRIEDRNPTHKVDSLGREYETLKSLRSRKGELPWIGGLDPEVGYRIVQGAW